MMFEPQVSHPLRIPGAHVSLTTHATPGPRHTVVVAYLRHAVAAIGASSTITTPCLAHKQFDCDAITRQG